MNNICNFESENKSLEKFNKTKQRLTNETFIEILKLRFGNKYDYSKVVYKNIKKSVELICSKHGSFFKQGQNLINGNGCSKCASEERINKTYDKLKALYNDLYDFNDCIIKCTRDRITINCKKHGSFSALVKCLLNGYHCPKCNLKRTKSVSRTKTMERKEVYTLLINNGAKTKMVNGNLLVNSVFCWYDEQGNKYNNQFEIV